MELWWKGEGVNGRDEWLVSSVDQIIKVVGHPSFEGVHHDVHLFLHRLHLHDNVGWSHISDGWTTHILSLWSALGITTFWPLLVSSLGTGTFLIFLLGIHSNVLFP